MHDASFLKYALAAHVAMLCQSRWESEVGVGHRAWACMGAGDDSLERGTGDPTHSLPPLSPLERV